MNRIVVDIMAHSMVADGPNHLKTEIKVDLDDKSESIRPLIMERIREIAEAARTGQWPTETSTEAAPCQARHVVDSVDEDEFVVGTCPSCYARLSLPTSANDEDVHSVATGCPSCACLLVFVRPLGGAWLITVVSPPKEEDESETMERLLSRVRLAEQDTNMKTKELLDISHACKEHLPGEQSASTLGLVKDIIGRMHAAEASVSETMTYCLERIGGEPPVRMLDAVSKMDMVLRETLAKVRETADRASITERQINAIRLLCAKRLGDDPAQTTEAMVAKLLELRVAQDGELENLKQQRESLRREVDRLTMLEREYRRSIDIPVDEVNPGKITARLDQVKRERDTYWEEILVARKACVDGGIDGGIETRRRPLGQLIGEICNLRRLAQKELDAARADASLKEKRIVELVAERDEIKKANHTIAYEFRESKHNVSDLVARVESLNSTIESIRKTVSVLPGALPGETAMYAAERLAAQYKIISSQDCGMRYAIARDAKDVFDGGATTQELVATLLKKYAKALDTIAKMKSLISSSYLSS